MIFEICFQQDQNKWKHKLIPIENCKIFSVRVFDLLIYQNHYFLNKKLHVLLGKQDSKFVCRRCLSSYSSQNVE